MCEPNSKRRAALLVVLLTGQAMASMDTSIAAVAAPTIRADLAGPPALAQLVLAGYTLAFAVLVVTGARLGSRHGPGRVFLLGLAGFTVASLACGLAPGPGSLVLARVVQGATAALLVPQVLTLIQARFEGAARTRAIGAYSMILALGVAAGQVVGGLLVTLDLGGLAWRAAFLVNVPVGVLLLVLGRRVLAAVPDRRGREALDPPGVLLLGTAMLTLVVPLVLGRDLGWPGWAVPAVAAAGAVGLGLFLRYEDRLARRGGAPLLDVTVLRLPGVAVGLLAAATVMGCYAGFLFNLTLWLQDGLRMSALGAGLAFLPYAAGFALCGLGVPRLPGRWRDALPVAGPPVLAVVVLAVWALSRDGWPWPGVAALLLVGGAAHAAAFSPLVARLAAVVPVGAAAALSALVATGTLLAAVLGVALLGGLHLSGSPGAAATATAALLLVGAAAAHRSRAAAPHAGPGGGAGDQDHRPGAGRPAVRRDGARPERTTSAR
ncbi:MFS transporter [Micromonospora echinaurantiaca]|uniref:MFS transporter n=1 Tax=Micromonospora echinaurantiaca TaxID=47857 RepID=UPI0037972308